MQQISGLSLILPKLQLVVQLSTLKCHMTANPRPALPIVTNFTAAPSADPHHGCFALLRQLRLSSDMILGSAFAAVSLASTGRLGGKSSRSLP